MWQISKHIYVVFIVHCLLFNYRGKVIFGVRICMSLFFALMNLRFLIWGRHVNMA